MSSNKKATKYLALTLLTEAVISGNAMTVAAAPLSGASQTLATAIHNTSTEKTEKASDKLVNSSGIARSGVSQYLYDINRASLQTAKNKDVANTETAQVATQVATQNLGDLSKIGIANLTSSDYVYIRTTADSNGDYAGKLYKGSIATVTGETGDWYAVTSGSVTGYINKEYLTLGDEAAVQSAMVRKATVNADALKVHTEPSLTSSVLTRVTNTTELTVVDESTPDWVKVHTEAGDGYVSLSYVSLATSFNYAVTKQEEEKAAAVATAQRGTNLVSFASQFVGNRYVWGGTSLTKGADCSGFVMSVYAHYGVSLPHSSAAMRHCGRGVSTSEMQPGDIVCYRGHVGIYAGGGMIVNALNKKSGIVYTPVHFSKVVAVRRIFN